MRKYHAQFFEGVDVVTHPPYSATGYLRSRLAPKETPRSGLALTGGVRRLACAGHGAQARTTAMVETG